MNARLSALIALTLAASLNACSHRTAGGAGETAAADSAPRPRATRADRYTITRAEIEQYGAAGGASNLFDFINTRHSDWLRIGVTGGINRFYQIQVYMDGVRFGSDPTALRNIMLSNVAMARKLSASEAEGKYGSDNNAGAIEVWTSLERVR